MVKKLAAILLAAGYGTRLTRDLEREKENYGHLLGLPKPLLPVQGKDCVLDLWIKQLKKVKEETNEKYEVDEIFVITNDHFFQQFNDWAKSRSFPLSNLLNDGTSSNQTRLGAVTDITMVVEREKERIGERGVVVVAGDTLFRPSFVLGKFLVGWGEGGEEGGEKGEGVVVYELGEEEDVAKRGIVEVEGGGWRGGWEGGEGGSKLVTKFFEKPQKGVTDSRLATPAFYVIRNQTLPLLQKFLDEKKDVPLAEKDAPGKWLCWLVGEGGGSVYGSLIEGRFDIGSLADYLVALKAFNMVEEKVYARVGLIGNPSDGFYGKTITVSIKNFFATVQIWPSAALVLEPHPVFDAQIFPSLSGLSDHVSKKGYYGGIRLIKATLFRFSRLLSTALSSSSSPSPALLSCPKTFSVRYDTNIPFGVGLAGSSAIVTATLRALFSFTGIKPEDLGLKNETVPNLVLSIEQDELGIKAGLQDRVAQWFEGVLYLDFSKEHLLSLSHGLYTPLPSSLLPPLFLVFSPTRGGGESGRIHGKVRERWENGEKEVVEKMGRVGGLAEKAKGVLEGGKGEDLGKLFGENFRLRREMYGDDVIGESNLKMIETCEKLGFFAKFCGSGGACVCVRREGEGWGGEEEGRVKLEFSRLGYEFMRLEVNEKK